MQLLSKADSRAWALGHGFPVNDSFGHPIASEVTQRLDFRIPPDAGARVALARALWDKAAQGVETLLWITAWGVWPSGEHQPLIEAARRGLGLSRPLIETPGHVLAPGESDAGLSLLVLSILFLWDCWVLPTGGRPAFFVSHDEYGIVDLQHGDQGLRELIAAFNVLDPVPGSARPPN